MYIMSDVEDPKDDVFATRSSEQRMEAQGRFMAHAELAGHVATAANVVMGNMPPDDIRLTHATEYLAMLSDAAERSAAQAKPLLTKWDKFLGKVGVKDIEKHAGETAYIAARMLATYQHTVAHGGDATDAVGGLMATTDMFTVYEQTDGIVAGAARQAVDSVMYGLILGEEFPAGTPPQEPTPPTV
jgi:hypothetical protein